jgi:hypothetical protein
MRGCRASNCRPCVPPLQPQDARLPRQKRQQRWARQRAPYMLPLSTCLIRITNCPLRHCADASSSRAWSPAGAVPPERRRGSPAWQPAAPGPSRHATKGPGWRMADTFRSLEPQPVTRNSPTHLWGTIPNALESRRAKTTAAGEQSPPGHDTSPHKPPTHLRGDKARCAGAAGGRDTLTHEPPYLT